MRYLIIKIRNLYVSIVENIKSVKKVMIFLIILVSIYHLIDAATNYKFDYFIQQEIYLALQVLAIVLIAKLFHYLFGKWYVHEYKRELTQAYVVEKLPRSVKWDGFRGVGKDSTVSGISKVLRVDIIQRNQEDMEFIKIICYPYDFDKLEAHLDDKHVSMMTNSKNRFFSLFIKMMTESNCFIKEAYSEDFVADDHLKELYAMRKNPDEEIIDKIMFKYDDGIAKQHFLSLLIKFSLLYIRTNYLPNYIVANQPYMEDKGLTAKMFSTDFTNIQSEQVKWAWPIVGGVIILETEADAFYPNVGTKGSAMKSGTRNFKAFFRHLMGEDSVWFQIGQRAARTEKSLRELDQAFITIIEQSKIPGGEKRIFFVQRWLSWIEFWMRHSFRKKNKEKQIRRKSKAYQKIKQLKNDGYIYVDMKIARSEESGMAEEMTLKQVLSYDKPIYENYCIKLCFRMTDVYGGYNTHYLEAIAEILANKTTMQFQDVPNWDPDLILKKHQIEFMNYPVLNEMAGINKTKGKKGVNNIEGNKKEAS